MKEKRVLAYLTHEPSVAIRSLMSTVVECALLNDILPDCWKL